jgi:hypothetical protein
MREAPSISEIEEAVRTGIAKGTHSHLKPSPELVRAVSREIFPLIGGVISEEENKRIPSHDALGSAG